MLLLLPQSMLFRFQGVVMIYIQRPFKDTHTHAEEKLMPGALVALRDAQLDWQKRCLLFFRLAHIGI